MSTADTYLSSREVAKILRGKLRETFPGVTFSVTCGRGTAYGYIHVSWTDGPKEAEVRAVCNPWQGADFDGMQDMSIPREALLVETVAGELPTLVRPVVDGIQYRRATSLARLLAAQDLIREVLPEFCAYDPDGRSGKDAGRWLDPPVIRGQWAPGPRSLAMDSRCGPLTRSADRTSPGV